MDKNCFKPLQRRGISENPLPEPRSIDSACFVNTGKRGTNGRNGSSGRRQQSVNRQIRIKQRHSEVPQHRRRGALAHTDRAGKTENNQGGARVAINRRAQLRRHPHGRVEPGLETRAALMQQHAEAIDNGVSPLSSGAQQTRFERHVDDIDDRAVGGNSRSRIRGGSPVMPRLVVLTSSPACR